MLAVVKKVSKGVKKVSKRCQMYFVILLPELVRQSYSTLKLWSHLPLLFHYIQ